jgi:hypothetical protein
VVVKGRGKLVRGTLLSGQVFESPYDAEEVWELRWTEATLPNGDKHPVCIEGGSDNAKCPNGGRRLCPDMWVNTVKKWTVPVIP